MLHKTETDIEANNKSSEPKNMLHKTETIIETQKIKARNPKTWHTEPKPNKQKAKAEHLLYI